MPAIPCDREAVTTEFLGSLRCDGPGIARGMLRLGRLSTASRTSVLVLGEFENDALHGRGGIALNGGDALAKWKSRCFAQIRDLSERMRVAGKTMEDLDADYTSRGSKPVADVRAPAFEYPKEAIVSYAQTRTFFYGAPCITYNPAFMLTLELTILPTCRLHGHFTIMAGAVSTWNQTRHMLRNSARNVLATRHWRLRLATVRGRPRCTSSAARAFRHWSRRSLPAIRQQASKRPNVAYPLQHWLQYLRSIPNRCNRAIKPDRPSYSMPHSRPTHAPTSRIVRGSVSVIQAFSNPRCSPSVGRHPLRSRNSPGPRCHPLDTADARSGSCRRPSTAPS
jgi:hypothetical protein